MVHHEEVKKKAIKSCSLSKLTAFFVAIFLLSFYPLHAFGQPLAKSDRHLLVLIADLSKGLTDPGQIAFYDTVKFAAETVAIGIATVPYQQVHVVKGAGATFAGFTDNLAKITAIGAVKALDVLFVTHGLGKEVFFSDSGVGILPVRDEIQKKLPTSSRGKLRILFSTACFGQTHINGWLQAGFEAASGSKAVYADSALSYPVFLGNWAAGQTFANAVAAANGADPLHVQDNVAKKVMEHWNSSFASQVDSTRVIGGAGSTTLSSTPQAPVAAGSQPTDTGLAGGKTGKPFSLPCGSNEVLVGLSGKSGLLVDGLRVKCIQITETGQWTGSVIERGATGGGGFGANDYDVQCPKNFAVSGFRGRAASFIDQLQLQCRDMTTGRKTTGAVTNLTPIGGSGGSPFGPLTCPGDRPAHTAYGRSGSFIDAVGFKCQ
jgi:hypothetical protein